MEDFDELKRQKMAIVARELESLQREVAERCARIAERKIFGTLPLTGDEIARIIRLEFGLNEKGT